MTDKFDSNTKAIGLYRHPNNLNSPDGALLAADECVVTRENIIERRKGYSLCNTGLPAAIPEQLFTDNNNLFVHINDSIYYESPGTCNYTQMPTGGMGNIISPRGLQMSSTNMYLLENPGSLSQFNLRFINLLTGYISTIRSGMSLPFGRNFSVDGTSMYYIKNDVAGNSCELRAIDLNTGVDSFIAGSTYGHADGVGAAARFDTPSGIIYDANFIYLLDRTALRKINKATAAVTTLIGNGTVGFTDGVGAAARMICMGLVSDGTFWWTTQFVLVGGGPGANYYLRKIDPATNTITTPNMANFFFEPDDRNCDLAVDSNYIYSSIALGEYSIIRWKKSDGSASVLAGPADSIFGYVDANGANARFYFDYDQTADFFSRGQSSRPVFYGDSVYFCDFNNNLIRRINTSTADVTTLIGKFSSPSSTDGSFLTSTVKGPD